MSLKPETLTPDTISQLQTLIQADPALIAQLQSCSDAASSAAVIAKAAAAKGMDVTEPDLVAHFEGVAAKQGTMSDDELEQVAGGGTGAAVLLSLAFPLACAITSALSQRLAKQDCKEGLGGWAKF